jgi:DNA-binding HxlR family transcriptional regulator
MEKDGLITRKSFNEVPPRVEYTLTDRGDSLVKVLWGLNEWGKELLGME